MDQLSQQEMANLIRVAWIVLIPGGVLLCMVLYQLTMLLLGLVEFLTVARYELAPAMKDIRLTAENVEVLSTKAVHGVKSVQNTMSATVPALQLARREVALSLESFWSGLKQSFSRKRF
jgi:hypothetical protein